MSIWGPDSKESKKILNIIVDALVRVIEKENIIMATLEEIKGSVETLKQKVVALNTALDGYRAAMTVMQSELNALKVGEHLPPAVQAKVDEISSNLTSAIQAVDDTYQENFPGTPPEEPVV
jgi:hypothetical protein